MHEVNYTITGQSNLQRLLNPHHIAVIGGNEAAAVIRQCDRIGYTGQIWPVNPKREEMEGRPCFSSLADLPSAPDATFIAVPREPTIQMVGQLAQMGAGGAICYASGFAEVGGQGHSLQEKLTTAMGKMAIVGPNCYGLLNYLDGVTLWPDEHGGKRIDHGAAIITQSGNISISISMQQRWLPLAYLIATGNQAGVSIIQYMDTLLEDKRVTAIGLHLEGLDDVVSFSKVALKALKKKIPVVVLKSGSSDLGSELTMSHTSSLAGADVLYDAFFNRFGIARVRSIPEFLETLKFLSIIGPLPTAGIASISSSGGEAAIVADRATAMGLELPPLHPAQQKALHQALGDRVALTNPLDYHTYIWGDEEAQYQAFGAMMTGHQSITLKILDFPRPDICNLALWAATARAFQRAAVDGGHHGAVLATMQENLPQAIGHELVSHGIAPMLGLDECLFAIRASSFIYAKQHATHPIQPLFTFGDMAKAATMNLHESASKALLRRYGVPVTSFQECTMESASKTAQALGFPIVLKVLSTDIVHKSDVGGVCLNLQTEDQVEVAAAGMAHLGKKFLVEKMAPKPVAELILGLTRDPQFGLVLVIGGGGILVELLQDSATLLLPVSQMEVEEALAGLKIAPLLEGYRGQPAADVEAIIEAALNLAAFAAEHADDLIEVDINPLFVYTQGEGVLAVDAVVRGSRKLLGQGSDFGQS